MRAAINTVSKRDNGRSQRSIRRLLLCQTARTLAMVKIARIGKNQRRSAGRPPVRKAATRPTPPTTPASRRIAANAWR